MDSDDQYISDARSVRGLTLALVFMCMLTVTQMMQARVAGQVASVSLTPRLDGCSQSMKSSELQHRSCSLLVALYAT